MANKRISSLDPLATPAVDDIIPVTDIDDTTGSPQGTTKKVTVANLVAVAPQGDLQSVNNLSDLADAATARTNLGVDEPGTDNFTDVTLAAVANNYLTLSGQEITAGIVPVSLGGTGSGDLATVRANLGLGTAATTDSTDYATSAQGGLADSAIQPNDNISTLTNDSGFITGLSAGALSDFDFDDNAIFGFGASVNTPTITANAYTLTDADNGKVLALDNGATAMTVNVNTGLVSGFNCSFIQTGSGQVTFAGTATLNNRQSHTKINARYGVASIVAYATDTYILAGDTAS